MTVSVIVPVYNSMMHINDCVESILAQTYTDLDIILIDDGSTDASVSICDDYACADPRVRVMHKPNGGLSSARNAGLDMARGEYITFVDSDDMLHPLAIETLSALIGNRDVAIAQFHRDERCQWHNVSRCPSRTYTNIEAIEETLYQRSITNSACAKLFISRVFDGLRFTEGLWYEDLDLFYKIYERADNGIISTSAKIYFYRNNPQSFINTFDRRRLDVLKVTENIERHYDQNVRLRAAARDRRFSASFNMFILSSRHDLTSEADVCWNTICSHRLQELSNPKVRIKNKIGALLSFLGKTTVIKIARMLYTTN